MESIFTYLDYRSFLKDYYNSEKESKKYFSYRFFSQKAGVKSPVFLKEVYDGKKNLSRKMIDKFCLALKFNKKESDYFRNLVQFNQAKTSTEKQEFYQVLKSMVKSVEQHILKTPFFEFYDQWYTCVIRELITQTNYKHDYELLAKSIYPPITTLQARKSVQLLLELQLIKRTENGKFKQTKKDISTGSEVASHVIRNHNLKMISLAENSIQNIPIEERYCKGITMGIDKETYDLLVIETEAYKDRILSIVNNCKTPNRVYELYLQLFPLSKKNGDE